MTVRRFKQMIIQLAWKGKTYNIRAESIKPTLKQTTEEYTATSSVKPYALAFEGQSYEFTISGIDPEHYTLFKEIFQDQSSANITDLFNLSTYEYNNKHVLQRRDRYVRCSMSELSNETAEPFDAKFSALDWQ